MENLKQLQEMKDTLERQIAEAIEAERARQRAIEAQQARLKEAELSKFRADLQMLMRKYDLTKEEILGVTRGVAKGGTASLLKTGHDEARAKSLREMRRFYSGGR